MNQNIQIHLLKKKHLFGFILQFFGKKKIRGPKQYRFPSTRSIFVCPTMCQRSNFGCAVKKSINQKSQRSETRISVRSHAHIFIRHISIGFSFKFHPTNRIYHRRNDQSWLFSCPIVLRSPSSSIHSKSFTETRSSPNYHSFSPPLRCQFLTHPWSHRIASQPIQRTVVQGWPKVKK